MGEGCSGHQIFLSTACVASHPGNLLSSALIIMAHVESSHTCSSASWVSCALIHSYPITGLGIQTHAPCPPHASLRPRGRAYMRMMTQRRRSRVLTVASPMATSTNSALGPKRLINETTDINRSLSTVKGKNKNKKPYHQEKGGDILNKLVATILQKNS